MVPISEEFASHVLASQTFAVLTGTELVSFEPGRAELRLPIKPEFTQRHGFAHGARIGAHPLWYKGGLELEVVGEDGAPHRACAGSVVHMPSDAVHGFFNCGDEPARVLSIGSSAQQTFFEDVSTALATDAPGSRAALDAAYAKHDITQSTSSR